MGNLDSKYVHQLRTELNETRINGVPFGDLCFGVFRRYLIKKNNVEFRERQSPVNTLKNFIYLKMLAKPIKGQTIGPSTLSSFQNGNPAILIMNNDHRRFHDQLIPIIDELEEQHIPFIIVFNSEAARKEFPCSPAQSIVESEILAANNDKEQFYHAEFNKIKHHLFNNLNSFFKKHRVDLSIIRPLMVKFLDQLDNLIKASVLVDTLEPRYIFTLADKPGFAAAVCTYAKTKGINSFKSIQGIVGQATPNNQPIVSHVFAWNSKQQELITNYTKGVQVLIGGAPQFNDSVDNNRYSYREHYGIDPSKKILLIAVNDPDHYRYKLSGEAPRVFPGLMEWAKLLVSSNTLKDQLSVIVRKHPRQTNEEYKDYIKEMPEVHFDLGNEVPFDQIFSDIDIVGIFNSTFAMDTLVKGIPIVIMDVYPEIIGDHIESLTDSKDIPHFRDKDEFSAFMHAFCTSENFEQDVQLSCKKEISNQLSFFGEHAAKQIVQSMQQKRKILSN